MASCKLTPLCPQCGKSGRDGEDQISTSNVSTSALLQAEYGPNMPGGADRLPEQTLEQGMGEVGTPKPHQHSPQGQARDGVNAAGSGLTPSKVQPLPTR